MPLLNLNHLWYFWMVAKEGSLKEAAVKLGVTQPAVTGNLKRLSRSLGVQLLEKSGRGVALTTTGAMVYAYADEIATLAIELKKAVERGGHWPVPFAVGVAEGVPGVLTHRLLATVSQLPRPVHLKVRHAPLARLMADLAAREVDLVLSTERPPAGSPVRSRVHALGESGIVLLAAGELARSLAGGFPRSLDRAPFILQPAGVPFRRTLDAWMQSQGVAPSVVAEMDDWAESLLLAQSGAGVVAVPSAAGEELRQRYALEVVGHAHDAVLHFYALTERRPRHHAVIAVLEAARANPIRG